jgi:hypothetical protein
VNRGNSKSLDFNATSSPRVSESRPRVSRSIKRSELSLGEAPYLMVKYPDAPPRPTMRRCPPHTPLKAVKTPGGGLVVECLGCGKRGPERVTSEAARTAFFDASG